MFFPSAIWKRKAREALKNNWLTALLILLTMAEQGEVRRILAACVAELGLRLPGRRLSRNRRPTAHTKLRTLF